MFASRVSCGSDGGDACLAVTRFLARMFLNGRTAGMKSLLLCVAGCTPVFVHYFALCVC